MKKIDYYKCDFCSDTGPKSKIEIHEVVCKSDPAKKMCDSCSHFKTGLDFGLYFTEKCNKGFCGDQISNVRFEDFKCGPWKDLNE